LGAVPHCIRATSDRVELTAVPEAISWITSGKFVINKSQKLVPTYRIFRPPIIIIIIIIIIRQEEVSYSSQPCLPVVYPILTDRPLRQSEAW
jgi:hypothetical protein